jgi:regulator of protease activity HflC (stomatin/prohibitin superfamily)
MRRVLPNVLLLLLLLFLLPIYQATPTTEVLALSILLLGAALFLGYANQPRGLELLAALTAIVSFIGVTFLGRSVGGANGGYCFLTLWLVALLVGFGVMWRRSVVVERGQILVINQLPDNRALVWREGFHRPVNPLFERTVAALPGYELILEAVFENLNTESLFNIDRIEVVVRYQIAEPREVVFCFPNREQSREALLQERPQADTTSEQVAFWTEMIRRQMLMEVEQAIRTIIANVTGPTDVARKRDAVARQTRERLQTSVKRWGIQVLDLRFLDVVIASDRIRAANRDVIIERERQDAERAAQLRAREVALVGEAHAQATARMVEELVRTLKAQGTPLSVEEIERIVITAMQRIGDQQQLSNLFRDLSTGATPSTTAPTSPAAPSTGTTSQLPPTR